MKEKKNCRCCKSADLLTFLDLGLQPLANSYHTGHKLKEYPLVVNVCQKCFHSQLSVVVDPDDMFKNYLYVSGTTQTFRNHCQALARDAIQRTKKNPYVLDIACNDGLQLEFFRALGAQIQGVDPAANLRPITSEKGIPVEVEYWTTKIANKLNTQFDIITGTNVFAHVDDVDEFLNACKIALASDGILILEFPYASKMIENFEFDTVYHEHLSYFLVHSFKVLVERLGFYIIDILQTPIHGGSIRFFLKKGTNRHAKIVDELIQEEKNKNLHSKDTFIKFTEQVVQNKSNFINLIHDLRSKNKKIIGYAASAKGNTMLNYFKIKLDYIVDDNSLKWKKFTPGQNIPITTPGMLTAEKDGLCIVILAWNFYKEIARRVRTLRGRENSDLGIIYVPQVKTFDIDSDVLVTYSA